SLPHGNFRVGRLMKGVLDFLQQSHSFLLSARNTSDTSRTCTALKEGRLLLRRFRYLFWESSQDSLAVPSLHRLFRHSREGRNPEVRSCQKAKKADRNGTCIV